MEMDKQESCQRRQEFVEAITSGNWQACVEQFAEILAQRDKLYLVAMSLCSHQCKGSQEEAQALLDLLFNELSEVMKAQNLPTRLCDEEVQDAGN